MNENPSFVTLEKNAYLVLPKGTEYSKAIYEVDSNVDGKIIARLNYYYADHNVGSAGLIASGAHPGETLFDQKTKTAALLLAITAFTSYRSCVFSETLSP